jgi:hypothetical protein
LGALVAATGCDTVLGVDFDRARERPDASAGTGGGGAATSSGSGGQTIAYRTDEDDGLTPLPYRGGYGGEPYPLMGCAAGEVLVGLLIYYGEAPYQLVPSCAFVESDGTLGFARAGITIAALTSAPMLAFDLCPFGSMVVGVHGWLRWETGGYVRKLGITCAPLYDWVEGDGDVIELPARGSVGERPFADECPAGTAIRSFQGQRGTLFDSIQGHCIRIVKEAM